MTRHQKTRIWERDYTIVQTVKWITEDLAQKEKGFDRTVLSSTDSKSDAGKCLRLVNKYLSRAVTNAEVEMKRIEAFLQMRQEATDEQVEAVKSDVIGKEDTADKAAQAWADLVEDEVESALEHLEDDRKALRVFLEEEENKDLTQSKEREESTDPSAGAEAGGSSQASEVEPQVAEAGSLVDKVKMQATWIVMARANCNDELRSAYSILHGRVTSVNGLKRIAAGGVVFCHKEWHKSKQEKRKSGTAGDVSEDGPSDKKVRSG